jgi:hypothetical protein
MKTRIEYWKGLKDMGVVDADYIAARENLPKPPKEKPVPALGPALPPQMAPLPIGNGKLGV